ncbi:hypothetical protein HDU93_001840 [Gonapodya sp. JEL0774]|nr:hypothetical protein HDU93_001840 [Gonapodya sp. JEL0774]
MNINQHPVLAIAHAGMAIPPEPISPITGWPVWLRPIGMSPEVEYTIAVWVVACTLGAAIYTSFILWARNVPYKTHSLHYVIAFYCWATFASMFISRILAGGTSKLFVIAGALHNMAEFVILFKFVAKDDEKREWAAWWLATLLYLTLTVLCHALPWPFDALWFKFQGMVADVALPIVFFALWRVQDVQPIEFVSAAVAAKLHFIGNAVGSIFGGVAWAFYFFTFTYATAYPLYAYWVNVTTAARLTSLEDGEPFIANGTVPYVLKVIQWPQFTTLQGILIFVLGVVLSGLIIVVGLKVSE